MSETTPLRMTPDEIEALGIGTVARPPKGQTRFARFTCLLGHVGPRGARYTLCSPKRKKHYTTVVDKVSDMASHDHLCSTCAKRAGVEIDAAGIVQGTA